MARRGRRSLKDLLTPDPTPDRQLEHPSGWCMTLTHELCPYQFDHGKCGCECHVAKESPAKRGRPKKAEGIKPDLIIVDETAPVDPRPWKR
jgi:hypothetical protein